MDSRYVRFSLFYRSGTGAICPWRPPDGSKWETGSYRQTSGISQIDRTQSVVVFTDDTHAGYSAGLSWIQG